MIQKRAKPEKVDRLRAALNSADAALCEAGRLNALTNSADRRLRDLIYVVRRFNEDLDRAAEGRPAPDGTEPR